MVQAVILAAGKSTRTYPLTLTKPKPLLPIINRPLLEHILDSLIETGKINEAIIVTGYKGEMIKDYFKEKYKSLPLKYSEQEQQLGTWDAVYKLKGLIEDRFVVLYGDNLHSSHDIKHCLDYTYSISLIETETPEIFGIAKMDNYLVKEFVEKPKEYVGNLASSGILVFDKYIFKYEPFFSESGEAYLTDMVNLLCKEKPVYGIKLNGYWLPVGYPWDLLAANEFFISKINTTVIEGTVEEGVKIIEDVHIGKGTLVKAPMRIEGPVIIGENCVIGPGGPIRAGTTIGDNCIIGGSEIKNSIIMDNVKIKHQGYIGDSILGEKVNIGAGTVAADSINEDPPEIIRSKVNGKLISTGRTKFGTVIGDGAKTGVNNSIKPGRKIWPGMKLDVNLTIYDDIMPKEKS